MDNPGERVSPPKPILSRAPLAGVALAVLAGAIAGRFVPFSVGLWLVLGVLALAGAIVTYFRPHLHAITCGLVAVVIGCLSAVNMHLAYFSVPADHIVAYTGEGASLATVRGRIVTSPHTLANSLELSYRRPPQTTFLLSAGQLRTGEGWADVSGLVRVAVDEAMPRLVAGQDVELVGRMGRYRGPDNPGQYDRLDPMRNGGVCVWMTVPAAVGVNITSAPQTWYERAIWNLRASTRQHLAAAGDAQEGRLINALITGDRHPALQELNRAMMESGTAHYLSISGSHLAIFIGFIYLLCRLASRSQRTSAAIALATLAGYMLLTEPSAPLLRSAIMAGCVCLAVLLQRRHAALNGFSAAFVILVAMDPLQLGSAGFQLSFGLVGGFLLLCEPVKDLLFGRWIRRRGLMVFRGKDRVRRWLYFKAADWLMAGVALNLVAYMVSAPLVAYHFGLFSPYAAILSTLLSPFIAITLVTGYLSMALSWPMPNVADLFSHASAACAHATMWTVEHMRLLPGLCFDMRPVSWLWVVLCFAVMAAILFYRRLPAGKVLAWASVVLLAAATVWTQRPAAPPAKAQLNLLAVGDGQCALLRTPSGATYIIDAGTRSTLDAFEQVLWPFLRQKALPSPRVAFVSHDNVDHYNAIPGLARRGELKQVYLNEYFGRSSQDADDDSAAGTFAEAMLGCHVQIARTAAGQKIALDDRTRVEVLWPNKDDTLNVNDTSLVLRVTCDGRSVLLPGDIGPAVQAQLAKTDIRADVLVLPHHGSWSPNLEQFIQAVNPSIILRSTSHMAATRHSPAGKKMNDLLTALKKKCKCLSTSSQGQIQVTFGQGKIGIETSHPE